MGDLRRMAPVLALLLLALLLLAVDLAAQVGGPVGWEEGLNARGALMVACGHGDRLLDLQYRPSCGGCSAEALLAAPLFALLGPRLLAWKLLPLGFHLLMLAAGALWLQRSPGPARSRVLLAWLLLEIGAPGFYRSLSSIAWGNHFEGAALGLLAVALALWADGLASRASRRLAWSAAGLVAGLSLSFVMSAAWAAGAVLVLALRGRARGGLLAALALPLGLLPALWAASVRPDQQPILVDLWTSWALAPPDALLRWLWTDFLRGGLWSEGRSGAIDPLAVLAWGGLWGLALVGTIAAARQKPRAPALLLALGLLLLAYLLRFDLWDDNPEVRGFDAFNLRYRVALWPLLALGAAEAAGRWRGAFAAVLLGSLLGLGFRVAAWPGAASSGWPDLGAPVIRADHAPDPTVPAGAPPQRLADRLGRPQDEVAAFIFIEGHADAIPLCRQHHVAEWGRRIELGGPRPGVVEAAQARLMDPADAAAFSAGRAQAAAARKGPAPGPAPVE